MTFSKGKLLKQERESKNLTIEDVARETKINAKFIEKIESGEVDYLPGGIYLKSFLAKYADFLDLDPEIFLKDRDPGSLRRRDVGKNQETPVNQPAFKKIGTFLGIFLMVLMAWQGGTVLSTRIKALKNEEGTFLPMIAMSDQAEMIVPKEVPLEVMLHALESTWIQVRVDDVIVFQNILAKNSLEKWHPEQKVELWVSDAGNIEVLLNKQPLGKPGKEGQAMKGILLTRKGMSIR